MGLFGGIFSKQNSGNSASTSNTTNNTYNTDESIVAGNYATALGRDASYFNDESLSYTDASSSWADNSTSFQVNDSSDRSTVTNWTGVDPGAVRVAQFGAELVRDVGAQQTEGMRLVAGFGADALRFMGASATDLGAQAGANYRSLLQTSQTSSDRAAQAWESTIAASRDLLGGIVTRAGNTADAAGRLAEVAISQAQPADGKAADTMRTALLIGAGLAALLIVPRLLKA